ncbi:MAG TPA: hypothetical protein VK178_00005, partial [Opitutaceae bacterium]|nr:hypothetical protein [Opitutaceae bacterium]
MTVRSAAVLSATYQSTYSMYPRITAILAIALAVAGLQIPPASAAISEWHDGQVVFRGEPAELFGPFALFRTDEAAGRRVPLRALDGAAAVRFANELAATPGASLVAELRGRVLSVQNGKLVPVDLSNRPAPEVLVVFYCSQSVASSQTMVVNFGRTFERLRAVYGSRIELLLCGVQTDAAAHQTFALSTWNPGLVTDYRAQSSMPSLMRHAPTDDIRAVALSRTGVELAVSQLRSLAELRRFIDQVTDLLYLLAPDSPATWADRLQYLNTTRLAAYAHAAAGPQLIGSPLRPDALRRKGVTDIEAQIEVGADGRATAVTLAPGCGVPETLRATISDGLRRGIAFSPAIDNGRPVAGTYQFRYEVPPAP